MIRPMSGWMIRRPRTLPLTSDCSTRHIIGMLLHSLRYYLSFGVVRPKVKSGRGTYITLAGREEEWGRFLLWQEWKGGGYRTRSGRRFGVAGEGIVPKYILPGHLTELPRWARSGDNPRGDDGGG
jgi:hypothetical protein